MRILDSETGFCIYMLRSLCVSAMNAKHEKKVLACICLLNKNNRVGQYTCFVFLSVFPEGENSDRAVGDPWCVCILRKKKKKCIRVCLLWSREAGTVDLVHSGCRGFWRRQANGRYCCRVRSRGLPCTSGWYPSTSFYPTKSHNI